MKQYAIFAMLATVSATYTANANNNDYIYANSVSAHSITTLQHALFNTVIGLKPDTISTRNTNVSTHNIDSTKLYGRAPMYGEMPTYGEYGDDGTVFNTGRNGGDENMWPTINNVWIDWQHHDTDMKLDDFNRVDNRYDLLTVGATGGRTKLELGTSEWGAFAGFARANQHNQWIDTDSRGGYFGLYNNYNVNNFGISFVGDAGAVNNNSKNYYGNDEFANIWLGVGARASYKITIDNSLLIIPNMYAAYTWIYSADYTSDSGIKINNDNFNMLEFAPGITMTKHITDGWFMNLDGQYIINFTNGGDLSVNSTKIKKLDSENYWQYGIGLSKTVHNFTFQGNLNRYDGGLSGWGFGLNIKYVF